MKKLISLSVVISMFSFAAFAQDTSLNRPSVPPSNMDTVPDTKKWSSKDSTKMDWNKDSSRNKQWPDTTSDSRNKWSKDSLATQRTMDTTASSTTLTTDSAANRAAAKEDWKMRKDQQDSMSTSTNTQAATTTESTTTETAVTDRILMRNDSLLILKDGEATALDKEYTLPSGAVVQTNGTVKYPSGKTVQLKNGQFIALAADEEKADKPAKKAAGTKTKKKSKS